ncbi:MAG: FabA/FabZ family ACP-dehydratase [Phycisphaerales bacterium]
MRFELVDQVLVADATRLVAVRAVTAGEEYLADHFPTFPVLPGVLMLEAMVQAARRHIEHDSISPKPWVLGRVRALKYGRFIRPGDTMRIEVTRLGTPSTESHDPIEFKGTITIAGGDDTAAASGRFSLRPTTVPIHVG